MHEANKFHAQFQLLHTNLITGLLCTNFLSQNQNCGCVCWIEPIHATSEVLLLVHYMVVENWLLLPAVSWCHQALFPWDVTGTPHSPRCHVILSIFLFCFCIGLQTAYQRSRQFFLRYCWKVCTMLQIV